MGFNPRQPRGKDGEWTGRGSGTHASGSHVTGTFQKHPKASSPTPPPPPKPATASTKSVIRRADRLQANGNPKKAEQILQEHRAKLVNRPTLADVQKAQAANAAALAANRSKQAEVKARLAENKAKIARSNYIIKNGLAGASDATIDAHMRAHGKK